MVARVLEQLGVFMGYRQQQNAEARLFRRLNDWLLVQSGGAWDHPDPIKDLLECEQLRKLALDYLALEMRSPRVAGFLGVRSYLRHRTPGNLSIPWGWKDPRNTYTLPFWRALFPHARVIHVLRHGVDVASSLVARQARHVAAATALYQRRRRLYVIYPKRKGFVNTTRCARLESAFSLWEQYVAEARSQLRSSDAPSLELRYEDLLANPVSTVQRLVEFTDSAPNDPALRAAIGLVEADRAYAYLRDAELRAFASQVQPALTEAGYPPD